MGGVGGEGAEGFAEGFDGEVVGIDGAVGHAEEHEVDGLTVVAHEVGVGALVAFVAGSDYELVVALCLVVELVGFHLLFRYWGSFISWITELWIKKYLR